MYTCVDLKEGLRAEVSSEWKRHFIPTFKSTSSDQYFTTTPGMCYFSIIQFKIHTEWIETSSLPTGRRSTHSRSVALSVFMNSCLARKRMSGSYLRTERLSLLWGSRSVTCVCVPTLLSALTWHPGWSVARGADVSPPAVRWGCPLEIHRGRCASHSPPECGRTAPSHRHRWSLIHFYSYC